MNRYDVNHTEKYGWQIDKDGNLFCYFVGNDAEPNARQVAQQLNSIESLADELQTNMRDSHPEFATPGIMMELMEKDVPVNNLAATLNAGGHHG